MLKTVCSQAAGDHGTGDAVWSWEGTKERSPLTVQEATFS
jgi:hypothetical protein